MRVLETWNCPSEFLETISAEFYVRLIARSAREMVVMCSPLIGNERGIFTCSILFPNEEIFKSEVGLKIRAKWDKKIENSLL